MMWNYGAGFDYGFFPLLWNVLWIVVVIWIFTRIFRRHPMLRDRTPEEILHERFAKGEIDEAEYKKRLDALKKNSK